MITVIGLGFVGLTTGLGFSDKGFKTYGYDIDKEKTDSLKKGKVPFHEPGLEEKLSEHSGDNFVIVDSLQEAIENSKIIFLCVGTPSDDSGAADLSYIYSALEDILPHAKGDFKVIVVKSTVPPSTTSSKVCPFISDKGFDIGKDIGVANNPEFLREGFAWDDFINPDRVVLGVSDDRSADMLREIYNVFDKPVHCVSLNTGEYIKYLSNTLLATMISYANEMSMIAGAIGDIDVKSAFKILHEDKRWYGNPAPMSSYVYPGCGFGGYCLPKDTQAMIAKAKENGATPKILEAVIETNSDIKKYAVENVKKRAKKEDCIGILGLSFKPDSDDVRDTPAKHIIRMLIDEGYKNICAYDPLANEVFAKSYPELNISYEESLQSIKSKSDVMVLLTAWSDFANVASSDNVIDCRYFL